MISSSGKYWATAISVTYDAYRETWAASTDFLDDGFANDNTDTGRIATEGSLRTRYFVSAGQQVPALTAAIDVILADMERLGIALQNRNLFYDDRSGTFPEPDDWKRLHDEQVERLGWPA